MSPQDDGGDAFPNPDGPVERPGMSLWDYYFAEALGWASDYPPVCDEPWDEPWDVESIARRAALLADAMIAERRRRLEAD